MSILVWAIIGLVAGIVASKVLKSVHDEIVLNIIWGIVGAQLGGGIANLSMPGADGITALSVESLFLAPVGAILVLTVKHAFQGRRRVHR